ncbi:MAG: DUF5317 domain-containing protein [Bacillota bacterium]
MALGLTLSLAVGLARGGRLGRLVDFEFKAFWAVIAAFALQFVLNTVDATKTGPVISHFALIHVAVYVILGYALWANRTTPGMPVVAVGSGLNFLVIAANGMRMPVSVDILRWAGMPDQVASLEAGRALTHAVLGPGTRLWFLSDVLAIPRPFFRPSALSLGDLLMLVGVFLIIQAAMLRPSAKAGDKVA